MTIQLPRRRSKQAHKAPIAPGPVPPREAAGGTELPLPHEVDQATGQTAARPDSVMRQAHADIERGLVDTDLRATPGLDAERRDELLEGERRRSERVAKQR